MNNTEENKAKTKYLLIVMLALILFVLGLITSNLIYTISALILASFGYLKGDNVLFKEYNANRKKKLEESQKVRDAQKQIVKDGSLFKK